MVNQNKIFSFKIKRQAKNVFPRCRKDSSFHTRDKNTLDLSLTSLPGQFEDIHSPDKLSDHDIVSGSLKFYIPPPKKPRRKVSSYQKGDYETIRKDALRFAKEKIF